MLVTVVGVFLAVELPQAVTLILIIAQYTFSLQIFARETGAIASLVCNLVILLSYPTNFFIYCAMSRAFRTTFAELFCTPAGRCSLDRRSTATTYALTAAAPTGKRQTANDDEPAASKELPDNDVDSNAIISVAERRREDADPELIEEQNETSL